MNGGSVFYDCDLSGITSYDGVTINGCTNLNGAYIGCPKITSCSSSYCNKPPTTQSSTLNLIILNSQIFKKPKIYKKKF